MTREQATEQARVFLEDFDEPIERPVDVDSLATLLLATQAACLEEAIKECEYELATTSLNGDAQFGARLMLETLREQAAKLEAA